MFGRGSRSEAQSRARDYARWLVRDHGEGAEAALAEKLDRKGASSAMLQVYKLARGELRKLRRDQALARQALTIWKPSRLDALVSLLRLGRKRSRGRRKDS